MAHASPLDRPPGNLAGQRAWLAGLALAALPVLLVLNGESPELVAAGVVALCLCALAVRWPLLAVAGIAVMSVSYASENLIVAFGAPSIAKLAAPGLALLIVLRWLIYREKPLVNPVSLFLLAGLFLIKISSLVWADSWPDVVDGSVDVLKEMLIATLTVGLMNRAGGFDTLVRSILGTAAVLCALGMYGYLTHAYGGAFAGFVNIAPQNQRFSGPLGDPNFWGAVLAFTLPLAFHATVAPPALRQKAMGAVILGLILFGIVMTQSRGAMVASVIGIGALTLVLERRQVQWIVGLGLAAIIVIVIAVPETLAERFGTILTASEGAVTDPAVEGRLASWAVARQLFFEHPLLGVGVGNFNVHYQAYALRLGLIFRGEDRSAHSLYLEYLAEQGLVGFLWFVGIVLAALHGALRASRMARAAGDRFLASKYAAFGAGVAAYMAAMIFLHDTFPRVLWLMLVTAISLPSIAAVTLQAPETPGGGPEPAAPAGAATGPG